MSIVDEIYQHAQAEVEKYLKISKTRKLTSEEMKEYLSWKRSSEISNDVLSTRESKLYDKITH